MTEGAGRRAGLRAAAGIAAAALLPACSNEPLTRLSGSAFGTPAELLLWGPSTVEAETTAAGLWRLLAEFDRDWPPAAAMLAQRLAPAAAPAATGTDADITWRALGLEAAAAQLHLPDPGGALLSLGQHQLALGERGYRPWHVGIPDPANGRPLLGLDLYAGERLVTVASYARYRTAGGGTSTAAGTVAAPDPGAGECSACSVVVRGVPATRAAVLASLLFRAARTEWPGLARSSGATGVLWIGRDGAIEATTVVAKRALPTDQRRRISETAGS